MGRRNFYDFKYVKLAATGRWPEILCNVAGIGDDYLSGRHGPCPKCGGNDRFRFSNHNENGSIICNQCGKGLGDGIDVICWYLGIKQGEAIRKIGDYLGIGPSRNGHSKMKPPEGGNLVSAPNSSVQSDELQKKQSGTAKSELKKIQEQITPFPGGWNQQLVAWWCAKRHSGKLITPESLRALGAFVAYYQPSKKRYVVLAIPSNGQDGLPIGYFLYNLKERTLPGAKQSDGSYEQLKVKAVGVGFGVTELKGSEL
jgi:hypothetical protein